MAVPSISGRSTLLFGKQMIVNLKLSLVIDSWKEWKKFMCSKKRCEDNSVFKCNAEAVYVYNYNGSGSLVEINISFLKFLF